MSVAPLMPVVSDGTVCSKGAVAVSAGVSVVVFGVVGKFSCSEEAVSEAAGVAPLTSATEDEAQPDKTQPISSVVMKAKVVFFMCVSLYRIKCVGVHGSISGMGCAPL